MTATIRTQAAIKEAYEAKRKEIKKLEVSGYASPEGGLDLNTRLAKERQKNAQTQNRRKSIRQNPKTTLQRLAAEGLKNPVNKPKTEYVPVAQQDRAVAS